MLFHETAVGISTLAFFLVATSTVALMAVASFIIIGLLKKRNKKLQGWEDKVQNEKPIPEAPKSKPEEPRNSNPPPEIRPRIQLNMDLSNVLISK